MTGSYDAIVVGGGHNGLTCGAYLARAGKSVLVLEQKPYIGGASVTEEFSPGFRAMGGSCILDRRFLEGSGKISLDHNEIDGTNTENTPGQKCKERKKSTHFMGQMIGECKKVSEIWGDGLTPWEQGHMTLGKCKSLAPIALWWFTATHHKQ